MSQQQNNLLSFLQKSSLFDQPIDRRRRSRSRRSRDRNSLRQENSRFLQSRFNQSSPHESLVDPLLTLKNHTVENSITASNYNGYKSNSNVFKVNQNYKPDHQSGTPYQPWQAKTSSQPKVDSFSRERTQTEHSIHRTEPSTQGFESVRIESLHCLKNVSGQLWTKIKDIDFKLESFHKKLRAWIAQELRQAQQNIMAMVESAFREQQSLIQAYISRQQMSFNIHLVNTRNLLQAEQKKVEELERHIRSEDWRKAAGEIVNSNLQRKIDNFMKECDRINPPQWTPKSFVRQHLQIIQLQVQEIFKLSTFAC